MFQQVLLMLFMKPDLSFTTIHCRNFQNVSLHILQFIILVQSPQKHYNSTCLLKIYKHVAN